MADPQRQMAAETEHASVEALRQSTLMAVHSYQRSLKDQLDVYKVQRAWKVMLYLRKAYTQLVRNGWKGRWEFFSGGFKALLGGESDLDNFELCLPDLWNYLPDALFGPIDGPEGLSPQLRGKVRRPDVIVFPPFDFQFRFQRPQQLAVALARRGHRVFWISPSPLKGRPAIRTLRENLWELCVNAEIDLYQGSLEEPELSDYESAMKALEREFGIAEAWSLVQFPFWRKLASRLRDRLGFPMIYDCMDCWQNWTAEPRISNRNLIEERALGAECDLFVVSSHRLQEIHANVHGQPLVVPNACDFAFFHSAPGRGMLDRSDSGPIIGYYGALAEWFDMELVLAVARLRPSYSFVLIGDTRDRDLSKLRALPNVSLLGEKNYREIPFFLREFDVCLIPFLLTEMTMAVDPVKLYEYFSQGKPVVATRMKELENRSELIYFGDRPEVFASQIDKALAEDSEELRAARARSAENNTWCVRAEAIAKAAEDTFPLVSIVVLTYNSVEFLQPFVSSIVRNTGYPRYELIFVDNNSGDGTAAALKSMEGPRIRLLLNEQNLGFAEGNNQGARIARGDFLLFMNPDTLVTTGWLGRLLRPLRCDASIGLVAPVTNFSGNETRVNSDYRGVKDMEEFAAKLAQERIGQTREIPMAPLLCAVLPRRTWNDVGELDVRYRVGMFEDDDFSMRIRELGYRIVTAEDCFIHHFGNGSFAKLPSPEAQRLFDENRIRFEKKWNKAWQPHKTRPGVQSPGPQHRMTPRTFFRPDMESDEL